jgi:phospholipid N-methyltransferase
MDRLSTANRIPLQPNIARPNVNRLPGQVEPQSGTSESFSKSGDPASQLISRPTFQAQQNSQPAQVLAAWPKQNLVIFGKSTQIPANIADVITKPTISPTPIGSERWVVTPQIEASHRQQVETVPASQLKDGAESELRMDIGPLLQRRYSGRNHLTVVELGPATSTTVAHSLSNPSNRYVAVEQSQPYLEKQMEFLTSDTIAQAYGVKGDTYNLPIKKESCDLLVTSCHPPFFSSSLPDRLEAFDEVYQALKPGGEFVLFPYDESKQPEQVKAFIANCFEPVDQAASHLGSDRLAMVFRKKSY